MNKITTTANGSLHCTGAIEVSDAQGKLLKSGKELWLCRCGASGNKPFCDGSHKGAGFRDEGMLVAGEIAPAGADAPLKVTLREDGPLKCLGPAEIAGADGRIVWRGEDTALCRCGASAKKPFCDGTHRRIGFKA
jgi:CDGSH-type Zn-finger protein